MASQDYRASQIRTIKVAVKQLGLDEETYRALLVRVTGKSSCAQMSGFERARVLDALKAQGFTLVPRASVIHHRPKDTRRTPKADNTPMLRKVEALLADAGRCRATVGLRARDGKAHVRSRPAGIFAFRAIA